MSMTREQAIKHIEDIRASALKNLGAKYAHGCEGYYRTRIELSDICLTALRPVSREQVEKVWPGCDFCKIELDDYPYIVAHSDYSSSDTCYEPSFCPICGKPLTDEAVDMVMERMEALKDGKGD